MSFKQRADTFQHSRIRMINQLEITPVIPQNKLGWLDIKLPKIAMGRLQSYIETAKKNPINWNHDLAGNLSESLLLEDKDNWFFQKILVELISEFVKHYSTTRFVSEYIVQYDYMI